MPGLPAYRLRPATADDVPALAALYAECARTLGPQVYTSEQVDAWHSFGADTPAFRSYVLDAQTWIAESATDGRPLGFCGIADDGEVHSLYVRADLGRCGLATLLLNHALQRTAERGTMRFAAWATPFSRPVFERAGFRLDKIVRDPFQGVLFDRYRLTRERQQP